VGAQLELSQRLLATLVVKPENMRRNLERSGGVVLSEAVMMALAPRIGRDRAHALVLQISRHAGARKIAFREAVAAHPEVRRLLSPRHLAAALDYRNSLGLAVHFVDEVLAAHARKR
jgi:adenylosuccinate lyase